MDEVVGQSGTPPLDDLICCPTCDALYKVRQPEFGERAVCARCHTKLIVPRSKAGLRIIALAVTVVILVVSASVFPFLRVEAGGATNATSILDAAFAFTDGPLLFLSLLLAALILFIPLCRVLLVIYVLVPVVMNRPPARHAKRAFLMSERLRAWSMAEIFAIGCAVALVKITDLANVAFGPAFWLFALLVLVVVLQDNFMCRWSVWKSLETR
ncbi:paraquat-inducible protein A [Aliiroseovarius sp. YM-037]|uniref:paraquat-inducible protein A n=1 Tax=Aliiroseovarius sp. YM-037 TaxID=3341728 RepID=UPI003A8027F4